jgi:hypothetical protein
MALTRRLILKLIGSLGVMFTSRGILAEKTKQSSGINPLRALSPFVDTLIPEDTTPSATQLGVDKALVDQANIDPNLAILLNSGCNWLNRVAQELGLDEFAELDQAGRENVVRLAELSPLRSIQSLFFNTIRTHTFRHYYAQPASWNGLGFSGPPQHRGFPNHAAPPMSPTT